MQERPLDTLSPYTPSLEITDVDHPSASSGYATLYTSVVPAVEGSNTGVQSSGYGEVQITETPPSSSDYTYTSAEASQNIPPAPAIPSEGEAICEIKTDPNNQLFDSFLGVNRLPRRQVTLGKELGHGAFGDVYQGQWGDKTVALKKIDVAHAQESLKGAFYGESPSREHIIEALQWEISRLSTVSHPNVVQFYGIYQTVLEGHTYVVMEFCTGGTLDRALQEKDVPWSKRWQWAVEMTQGLAYLHDKGVLHRDLKAENILIDGNGCAKLADLGVAQADTLLAETEAKVVAKGLQDKHFIAPENIKHPTLSDVKTDIYALGLVLWQLAVGRPDSGEEKPLPRFPGTGLSHKQCQEWSQGLALAEREPIPVDCPDGFRDLILVCWQHDPTKRPTASALLTQLYALGNAPDISHPEPALLATCEQLTNLIHAKRLEGLSYVAPYLTQYALSETIEDYWWRVEALADPKQDGNPPLNLLPTLDQFVKDADAQSLLLLGDSGLGKTLSTYLLADRLLADWWAYLHDPLKPMPAYLPVFVRPALSQWSHTVLREEGFAKVRDFYQLPKNPSFGLLLIVDGYDECQVGDAPLGNLASQLGILSRTPVKLLVTSRPHTVAKEQLRERFALNGQLQTNYFLPFKREQMLTYLTAQLSWDTETQAKYQTDLEQATALRTVLRNPFVLHLFVQSFPTLKDKNFQQLNRWQIYESAVEEWLRTHQGLLSEAVRQKLTEGQINLTSLVKSFAAFASSVAFTAFQQGNITLSQAEVAQLDSPWGRLREEVKQDGKEIFQGYRLALCTIHKEISPSIVQQLNYLERNKKKLTLPALIEWQSPEEGNRYFVYGLTADGEPQLTPLQTDVLPPALVFEKGEKLFVSAQQHPLLYQTISETKAHVKSADRRSLLSEADYLTILGERCEQFGEGAPLKQRSEGVEFTHKSFFEYFAAKRLIGLSQSRAIKAEGLSLLNARSLQEEPEVLGFWVEGWQSEWRPTLIEPLFEIVQSSREEETHTVAASNAATLLAKARVSFSGRDLHTVHIVGADLSGALLHFTNFREADLREVNLQGAFLRETDLRGAKMAGTAFGEFPRLSLKEEVRCTAISSDRSLMAVGLKNGTIVLFGGEHYSEKQGELKGHTRDVTSVAFSPDGKYLISGGMDFPESDSVRLWDVESQKSLAEWKWSQVLSVAFSTDGNCLAWGGLSNTIMLWNINAKKSITELKGHTSYILSLAFSPDGKLLASGSYDHTICLWNMESLMPLTELKGHTSYVSSIAFSSDGKLLASGSLDRTVRVWDMESQKLFTELKRHIQGVHSVAFSPDGKRLVSGGGNDDGSGEIFLWDIKSQKLLIELQGHTQGVHSVTFSLDGDIIISGSYDNTIRLWDIGLQKSSLYLKGHIDIVWSVAFSPDGKRLVSGGNRELFLWDMESQKFFTDLKGHTEAVHSVAFSPDGKRLVSGGNRELFLWDMELQKLFTDLKGHTEAVHSVAFSPDGKRLVSGGGGYENGELFLWDMESQKLFTDLKGHTEAVHSVTFSPDGKHLVSGSSNLILESEKLMARTPPVKEQLFLWDIEAKNSLTRLKGCKSRVNSVAFSPDGKHLVSGGGSFVSFDLQRGRRMTSYGIIPTELILWDIESKKLLTKLEGHTREVMSVAFSPDGKRLVSGSWDRTVRVWNMESLMPLAELKGHTHWVSSVAFSPDGKLLASGSADYAIFLWGCTNVDKQEMWVLKSRFVTAFVLCAVNAHLKGAGISPSNKALLLQNGAEDELPLTRERTTFIPNTDIELQALLSEGNRTLLKQQGANDIALVYGDFYIK